MSTQLHKTYTHLHDFTLLNIENLDVVFNCLSNERKEELDHNLKLAFQKGRKLLDQLNLRNKCKYYAFNVGGCYALGLIADEEKDFDEEWGCYGASASNNDDFRMLANTFEEAFNEHSDWINECLYQMEYENSFLCLLWFERVFGNDNNKMSNSTEFSQKIMNDFQILGKNNTTNQTINNLETIIRNKTQQNKNNSMPAPLTKLELKFNALKNSIEERVKEKQLKSEKIIELLIEFITAMKYEHPILENYHSDLIKIKHLSDVFSFHINEYEKGYTISFSIMPDKFFSHLKKIIKIDESCDITDFEKKVWEVGFTDKHTKIVFFIYKSLDNYKLLNVNSSQNDYFFETLNIAERYNFHYNLKKKIARLSNEFSQHNFKFHRDIENSLRSALLPFLKSGNTLNYISDINKSIHNKLGIFSTLVKLECYMENKGKCYSLMNYTSQSNNPNSEFCDEIDIDDVLKEITKQSNKPIVIEYCGLLENNVVIKFTNVLTEIIPVGSWSGYPLVAALKNDNIVMDKILPRL